MKILFALMIILPAIGASLLHAEGESHPIAQINPKGQRDFPGGRGENQLIVYTDAYGEPSTGTNEWGAEAVVNENHLVVFIGGNNTPIRKGEMVISGHGTAKDWILKIMRLGSKTEVAEDKVTVSFDGASFMYLSADRLKELRNKFTAMKKVLNEKETNRATVLLDEIDGYVRKVQSSPAMMRGEQSFSEGFLLLDELDYVLTESPTNEGRGVWHRPKEKNTAEIDSTVARFAHAGFNMLFVETIWRGESIYPGSLTQQKTQFKDWDPLAAFINSGKRYGVEIHAWIHTFFVGYLGPTDDRSTGPILTAHPEWSLVKRNGEKISKAENGYLFVCPARPEVQDYIASLYKEVATLYPGIGGLQLDYIRYPVNSTYEESSCYCNYCLATFMHDSGIDAKTIAPDTNPGAWQKWETWREEKITKFVQRVRKENPNVHLSAAVFPDVNEARHLKMQNWGLWARERNIDFLAPMIYSADIQWVKEAVEKLRFEAGRGFPIYAGLAPFLQLTPEILLKQIEASRSAAAFGVILFASESISEKQAHLFNIGPFRNKAVSNSTSIRHIHK
jgi:uncharacterized lipoprotein YddW (UPF0748 family)